MNFSTIISIASGASALNVTMASRRLRNSGENSRSIASLPRLLAIFFSASPVPTVAKPIVPALISREPALLVMISTTWRKSALRPLLSVSVA